MSHFHNLVVKRINKETEKAVSVYFEIPHNLKSKFNFIPGQYVTIQKKINGETLRRAYSLCSSFGSNDFCIAIKEVENGKFSVYANRELKVGDTLEVSEPEGNFTLNPDKKNQNNYLAFAAGSGITPVMSMIKSVLETEPKSKFVLVFGNKSKEETIFKQELDNLVKESINRLYVHYVFSREKVADFYTGRINNQIVDDIIDVKHGDLNFDSYYLCGPEEMINLVKDSLIKKGVEEKKIKFELFTESSEKNIIANDLKGETKVEVILDDEEYTFSMKKDELILNKALEEGLDAPYSCQGGICSSCLARVVEGKAVMEKNTILDKDEVDEGLILTCQAHPVTDHIKIDYDDV